MPIRGQYWAPVDTRRKGLGDDPRLLLPRPAPPPLRPVKNLRAAVRELINWQISVRTIHHGPSAKARSSLSQRHPQCGGKAPLTTNRRAQVVFLTAFDRYAAEAFVVEAADCLLKPVSIERLRLAIERVQRRPAEQTLNTVSVGAPEGVDLPPIAGTLHMPDRDGGRDLLQTAILWIESAKDNVLIYILTRRHILRIAMLDLARQLDAYPAGPPLRFRRGRRRPATSAV